MMPKRSNELQKLATLVQRSLAPTGAKITESKLVDVPGQSEPREIDVLIETKVGLYRIKIAVEVKDEGRKMDSTKFEAIVGKYLLEGGVKVDKIVIVTHRGFYKPVIERAKQLNVELFTLQEASEFDWSQIAPHFLNFKSHLSIGDILITPPIPSISNDVVLREGRVICSHGTNFGNPEQFAWHLTKQNVIRHQSQKLLELDERGVQSKDGAKAKIDYKPDHAHVLRLNGKDFTIDGLSYILKFLPGTTVPPTLPSLKLSFAPHICRIEFDPPITDIAPEQLQTVGRIICKCCGKDHGTIAEFSHCKVFKEFFPNNPKAIEAFKEGLRNSPDGQAVLSLDFPMAHKSVRVDGQDHAISTIKIHVHAISATARLECKQYNFHSTNGDVQKLVSHLEATLGGKKIRIVLPDGTKSEKIVVNVDSAPKECC